MYCKALIRIIYLLRKIVKLLRYSVHTVRVALCRTYLFNMPCAGLTVVATSTTLTGPKFLLRRFPLEALREPLRKGTRGKCFFFCQGTARSAWLAVLSMLPCAGLTWSGIPCAGFIRVDAYCSTPPIKISPKRATHDPHGRADT